MCWPGIILPVVAAVVVFVIASIAGDRLWALAFCHVAGGAGVGAKGAVPVRPDRVIAWRSVEPPGAAALETALRTVFDR